MSTTNPADRRATGHTTGHTSGPAAPGIDPRGPQFTAAVTAVVLIAVLLLSPGPFGVVLLGVQTALFGLGAGQGVQHTPLAWVFRTVVKPRLSPPAHLEDPAPPRFAQTVGLTFGVVGLVGFLSGVDLLGFVAVGFALVAALLNAVFAFCLGCEMYLVLKRATTPSTSLATNN